MNHARESWGGKVGRNNRLRFLDSRARSGSTWFKRRFVVFRSVLRRVAPPLLPDAHISLPAQIITDYFVRPRSRELRFHALSCLGSHLSFSSPPSASLHTLTSSVPPRFGMGKHVDVTYRPDRARPERTENETEAREHQSGPALRCVVFGISLGLLLLSASPPPAPAPVCK